MSIEDAYYRRRAQEEREAGMKAKHPKARRSHMELADAYEIQARNVEAVGRRSEMRVVRSA